MSMTSPTQVEAQLSEPMASSARENGTPGPVGTKTASVGPFPTHCPECLRGRGCANVAPCPLPCYLRLLDDIPTEIVELTLVKTAGKVVATRIFSFAPAKDSTLPKLNCGWARFKFIQLWGQLAPKLKLGKNPAAAKPEPHWHRDLSLANGPFGSMQPNLQISLASC